MVGVDGHERVHLRVLVEAQQPEAVKLRGALVALVDQHHRFPARVPKKEKEKKKKPITPRRTTHDGSGKEDREEQHE